MNRYIDAEDFAAEVRKISKSPLNEWDTWGVLSALERVPTADVAPIIHAHWEEHVYSGGKLFFWCSNCGHEFTPTHCHIYNYCFSCGAKMDEVVE